MKTRAWIAASLDGHIATKDGGIGWLERWNPYDFGYTDFIEGIGAVAMGRSTYETAAAFPEWPYKDQPAYVLSATMRSAVAQVALVSADPRELHEAAKAATTTGDLWLVGGGRALAAFLDAGLVDEIEVFVMPILLGDGIPLFPPRAAGGEIELIETELFRKDGVIRQRYAVRRGTTRSATSV
jgi:dihydrofolate reductase